MKYRESLPQLKGHNVTTTGGMETWLQYKVVLSYSISAFSTY